HGLGADQRVALAAGRVHELEGGCPREAERLSGREALLDTGLVAPRGHAAFVGRHVGADLPGGRAEERGRILQPVPLLLALEERVVHLPVPTGALLTHT